MRVVALACLLLAGIVVSSGKKSYKGFQVLSTKAASEEQVSLLWTLRSENPDLIFLREPSMTLSTDVAVSPEQRGALMQALREAGLDVSVISTDLQEEIDAEMKETMANKLSQRSAPLKNGRFSPAHNVYYTMSEINTIMSNFEASYPDLVVRKQMDKLTEANRWPVYYMEMGTAVDSNGNSDKPVIFIEGMSHAREWIVAASFIYSVDQMLSGFVNNDPSMVEALTKFTWVIIPVVNPDGYDYSWTTDRMWRKNRKFISNQCTGVDLNRNFDVDFGNVGVSFNCREDIYPGPAAFSESETQNVADLFRQLKPRVVSFLSVHSYSQLLLYPWGYIASTSPSLVPSNLEQLIRVGEAMKTGLQSQGRVYDLGTAYGVLGYAASGAAEDWALQEKAGIYAYCYELRPRTYNDGGFIISPSNIVPSGQEVLTSLLALVSGMIQEGVAA